MQRPWLSTPALKVSRVQQQRRVRLQAGLPLPWALLMQPSALKQVIMGAVMHEEQIHGSNAVAPEL